MLRMNLFNRFETRKQLLPGRLVLLSLLVGIVAGCGALLFNVLLGWADEGFMVHAAGYHMPQAGGEAATVVATEPSRRWALLLIPTVGGLLSGLLVYTFAPEAEGHGTDAMVDAFHRMHGFVRARVPLVKTIASALTIGSGGSAGREGPIAQIGAGFGSSLATWLRAGDRERRLLMLAGAAGGLGAVFRAPLGAAFFVVEVLYRDVEFEAAALIPSFVSSIVAYSVYCAVSRRWGAIFTVPELKFNHPLELLLYVALGGLCAFVGVVHVKFFYGVRNQVFRRLPVPNHIKPALGGMIVGAIGFFVPQVLGMGYGWTQLAIDGQLSLRLALMIVVLKIVATGVTIGSGGSGGVFAPSMVIGACLGRTVGTLLHAWIPGVVAQPAAFVLVGMAGFFAGVSKAPVATLIMVSEMATGYGLLVPLMLTTAVAYLLTPRRISIYEKQLDSRADSPAHEGEYVVDLLERIHVQEAMPKLEKLAVLRLDAPLLEILDAVADSKQHVFPVLDAQGELYGVILFDDIRLFFTERNFPKHVVIAQDLLAQNLVTVTPDEDLASALQKLRQSMQVELVVVEQKGSRKVVGILGRRDILSTYQDRVRTRAPDTGAKL
jgi:CIC family chloride channel protein